MASAAQVSANRSNAQKSTGPRTAAGKAVAAAECRPAWSLGQGGRRQRGRSRGVRVLPGADAGGTGPGGPDGRDAGPADRGPVLAACAGPNACRRRRMTRSRTRTSGRSRSWRPRMRPNCWPSWSRRTSAVRSPRVRRGLGGAGLQSGAVLDRLLVYERRIEHSLYRTMAELRLLRRLRVQGGVSSVPIRTAEAGLQGLRFLRTHFSSASLKAKFHTMLQ